MDEEIIIEDNIPAFYNGDVDGPRAYTYRIVRVSRPEESLQPEEEISEPNVELE